MNYTLIEAKNIVLFCLQWWQKVLPFPQVFTFNAEEIEREGWVSSSFAIYKCKACKWGSAWSRKCKVNTRCALMESVVCLYVRVSRSVLVKRMFRPAEEDLCPSPHKQPKEEMHKRGTGWLDSNAEFEWRGRDDVSFTLCNSNSSYFFCYMVAFRLHFWVVGQILIKN